LLVSGCYFSSGRTIEPTAYLRKGNSPGSTESIEIRGTTWTTGNSHVPFDFTVYEQDSTFEIRVPSLVGETQAKDMQLWTCGVRLETFSGIVRPVADGVLVNLDVPDPSGLEKTVKIHQVFRLLATDEPTKPCEERKHYGPKRS
jgi:hypothetical protein